MKGDTMSILVETQDETLSGPKQAKVLVYDGKVLKYTIIAKIVYEVKKLEMYPVVKLNVEHTGDV
jgi:hypothetical protein